jgi:arabinose-5-phosphate isomerase
MSSALQRDSSIPFDQYRHARDIILQESAALQRLAANLPAAFDSAVAMICRCRGAVIVSGIGKAGWIAQKISATMASTGTRSHFLHPAEALHGDLGRIGPDDIVVILSNSGETAEVLNLLPPLARSRVPLISIVASGENSLARASDVVLSYGRVVEACPLGLAPSTSTTLMLALGDALALVASRQKQFRAIDFARHHPGGSLGMKLSAVDDVMRPLDQCRVARDGETVRSIYIRLRGPRRRSGAILLVDHRDRLSGIFTDSDLARLLERQEDHLLDQPVANVMTHDPKTIVSGSRTAVAVELLSSHNISELPVIDRSGKPLGIIDVTDVVGLM